MPEQPLIEYEVKYTRTVYTWVRVAAESEHAASKLAAQRLDEAEVGALCAQCVAGDTDITIEEDENSEASVEEVEDPTDHVILVHDFTLVDDDEDEDQEEDDDDED